TEPRERFLEVERDWIVDLGPDALFGEIRTKGITVLSTDHELVVDVTRNIRRDNDFASLDGGCIEHLPVPPCVLPAGFRPRRQIPELDAQDCGLNRVQPEVAAEPPMVISG